MMEVIKWYKVDQNVEWYFTERCYLLYSASTYKYTVGCSFDFGSSLMVFSLQPAFYDWFSIKFTLNPNSQSLQSESLVSG